MSGRRETRRYVPELMCWSPFFFRRKVCGPPIFARPRLAARPVGHPPRPHTRSVPPDTWQPRKPDRRTHRARFGRAPRTHHPDLAAQHSSPARTTHTDSNPRNAEAAARPRAASMRTTPTPHCAATARLPQQPACHPQYSLRPQHAPQQLSARAPCSPLPMPNTPASGAHHPCER